MTAEDQAQMYADMNATYTAAEGKTSTKVTKTKNIGKLGNLITFKTSDKKIMTFTGLTQKASGKWQKHTRIGKKPLQEFVGPELREISFTIEINALHGYKPRKTLASIKKSVERGIAHKFVLGGKRMGANYWVITSVSETWDEIYSGGELVSAKAKLTLEEYL